MDGMVNGEGGGIHGPPTFDDDAVWINEDQVADLDLLEARSERTDPEVVGEFWIASGDVTSNALGENLLCGAHRRKR